MVSPLRSFKGPRAAAAAVLRALRVSKSPEKTGFSVLTLPDGSGHIVTVVELTGTLRVHMVRIDEYGEITSLLSGRDVK